MKSCELPRGGRGKTNKYGPGISIPQTCIEGPPCYLRLRTTSWSFCIHDFQLSGPSELNLFSSVNTTFEKSIRWDNQSDANSTRFALCSGLSTILRMASANTKSMSFTWRCTVLLQTWLSWHNRLSLGALTWLPLSMRAKAFLLIARDCLIVIFLGPGRFFSSLCKFKTTFFTSCGDLPTSLATVP